MFSWYINDFLNIIYMNCMLQKTKKKEPRKPCQNSNFQSISMVNFYYNWQIEYCPIGSHRCFEEPTASGQKISRYSRTHNNC